MKRLLALLCLSVSVVAQATNWRVVGITEKHHDEVDLCAGLAQEAREKLRDSCIGHAYTETTKFLVDTQSIRREGSYFFVWEESQVSRDGKNWRKESRSLVVTDCDGQRTKLAQLLRYSEDGGISETLNYDDNTAVWHYVVPQSIGETELHFVCARFRPDKSAHP